MADSCYASILVQIEDPRSDDKTSASRQGVRRDPLPSRPEVAGRQSGDGGLEMSLQHLEKTRFGDGFGAGGGDGAGDLSEAALAEEANRARLPPLLAVLLDQADFRAGAQAGEAAVEPGVAIDRRPQMSLQRIEKARFGDGSGAAGGHGALFLSEAALSDETNRPCPRALPAVPLDELDVQPDAQDSGMDMASRSDTAPAIYPRWCLPISRTVLACGPFSPSSSTNRTSEPTPSRAKPPLSTALR